MASVERVKNLFLRSLLRSVVPVPHGVTVASGVYIAEDCRRRVLLNIALKKEVLVTVLLCCSEEIKRAIIVQGAAASGAGASGNRVAGASHECGGITH